jgi:hypothetical protein
MHQHSKKTTVLVGYHALGDGIHGVIVSLSVCACGATRWDAEGRPRNKGHWVQGTQERVKKNRTVTSKLNRKK